MKKTLVILLIIFIFIFVVSLSFIAIELKARNDDIVAFEELSSLTNVTQSILTDNPEHMETEMIQNESKEDIIRDITPLFQMNPDFISWISVPGTGIDYPIMHTPYYPEKYLRNNFEGQYSASGVPFLDGRCDTGSSNLIIYGHNMSNGTMFAPLLNYKEQSFFAEHQSIELQTIDGIQRYSVFAVAKIKGNDEFYTFIDQKDEEYNYFVSYIKSLSLYETGILPEDNAQIITLSTCYGRNGVDRLVVVGVKNIDE